MMEVPLYGICKNKSLGKLKKEKLYTFRDKIELLFLSSICELPEKNKTMTAKKCICNNHQNPLLEGFYLEVRFHLIQFP